MRTTITLDPDVDALVKKAMGERHQTFKQAVNDAIRQGLTDDEDEAYELPTYRLGPPKVNLDKALQLAGELEDAEILAKMKRGQ